MEEVGEMGQSEKCLSHKHENLNSDSRIYINPGLVVCAQKSQGWEAEIEGSLELSGQVL